MANRPKNYCPKEMEGRYYLTIEGNSVEIVRRNGTMKESVAYCHPDDTFDIGEAVRIGMERIFEQEIKIGDNVKVVDNGLSCCTYPLWPESLFEFACRYRFGVVPSTDVIYQVVAEFNSIADDKFYVIQPIHPEKICGNSRYKDLNCRGVYLIEEHGVKKV